MRRAEARRIATLRALTRSRESSETPDPYFLKQKSYQGTALAVPKIMG